MVRGLDGLIISLTSTLLVRVSLFVLILTSLYVSVFNSGLQTEVLGSLLSANPEDMAKSFGGSDAGSHLTAAISLTKESGVSIENRWVLNLWPPGMVVLNAFLVSVFGDLYGVAYAWLVVLAWTLIISFFANEVLKKFGVVLAFLAPSLLIVSSPFQNWILTSGLFYAEGFSQIFFLSGMIFMIKSFRSLSSLRALSLGLISGSLLALAAYFRPGFSVVAIWLLLCAVAAILWLLVARKLDRKQVAETFQVGSAVTLSSASASMLLVMEPWLQYTTLAWRGYRTWTTSGGLIAQSPWLNRADQANWTTDGGIGWACELNPVACSTFEMGTNLRGGSLENSDLLLAAIQTALTQPFHYVSDRFKYISLGWFSSETSIAEPNLVWGVVSLAMFLLFLFASLKGAAGHPFLIAFLVGLVALLLLPLLVIHVEPRYLIPLKMLPFLLPWLLDGAERIQKK